jgi:hypothetical protein
MKSRIKLNFKGFLDLSIMSLIPPPYMSTSLQETQEKSFFLESSNYQNCQISQKSSLKDFLIVKTDASNTGYGEILKHKF